MRIDFEQVADVLLVRLRTDRVEAASASGLKSKVNERLGHGPRKVVLDLAQVQFIDSTGLGTLLSLLKHVSPAGSLVLCGCQPSVSEVIKLTRLDRIFQMFPDAEAACAALAGH